MATSQTDKKGGGNSSNQSMDKTKQGTSPGMGNDQPGNKPKKMSTDVDDDGTQTDNSREVDPKQLKQQQEGQPKNPDKAETPDKNEDADVEEGDEEMENEDEKQQDGNKDRKDDDK